MKRLTKFAFSKPKKPNTAYLQKAARGFKKKSKKIRVPSLNSLMRRRRALGGGI